MVSIEVKSVYLLKARRIHYMWWTKFSCKE